MHQSSEVFSMALSHFAQEVGCGKLARAPTLRKVVAFEQRGSGQPLRRGDRTARRGAGRAFRSAVRIKGDHPLLHVLALVAGGGMKRRSYLSGLGMSCSVSQSTAAPVSGCTVARCRNPARRKYV